MLTILEDIRAEAEKLWQAGVHEAESIMKKAEEAIGMHKAATEEPANEPAAQDGGTLHVIGDVAVDGAITETPPPDAAPASTDPAPAAPGA